MAIEKGSVSIEAQNIMPVIRRWLYSDKDIFLREVVSNGCDAITKYRMLHVGTDEDMRVTVTVDKEKKELAHLRYRYRYDGRRGSPLHQSGGLLQRRGVHEELSRRQG